MKVLTKNNLLLLISNSPKETYDEREISRLFDIYGDDYFIEGNRLERFGQNEKMIEFRKMVEEMEKYLP